MPEPASRSRTAFQPALGWFWTACLLLLLLPAPPLHGQAPDPQAQSLVVGLDQDYPPYEFLTPQGQVAGFNVDLIRAVARVMGMNLELRPGVWGNLRDDLLAGRIQILTSMLKSPEREPIFAFATPPIEVRYSLFMRRGSALPRNLEKLQGLKILVQRGSQMHEHLLAKGIQDSVVPVESELEALRQLAAGRQDAALVAHLTGLMLIRQGGVANIQPVGQPVLTRELCLTVRKGDIQLLTSLNTGLAILRRTGEYQQIHSKWFGELEDPTPSTRKALAALAITAGALLLILTAVLIWNRTLQRRVLKHTRELQAGKDFLQAVIDSLPLMLFAKDPNRDFAFSLWNRKAEEMTGTPASQLLGTRDRDHFPPEQAEAFRKADEEVMGQGILRVTEEEPLDTGKGRLLLRTLKVPIRDPEGRPLQLLGISEDITERKRLEQALAQIQHLESLGVMAGGVAHDFNNHLMGIQGNLDLASWELPEKHPAQAFLQDAATSIRLAANLTNQMLAYSGQSSHFIRPLDLNRLITTMQDLLVATTSRKLAFHLDLDETLPLVEADEHQIQQVVLNLVINASEAIGDRPGNLRISTRRELLEAESLPGQLLRPGLHSVLQVEDDGCGMEADLLPHIFEPFFTTKFTGRGLGLSAVQGILKAHKGAILVSSQPELGSTFKVFLPAAPPTT
ncbi:transporter substrate-binding domain-containing protein [Holophaga foetida]|uniref:transporter substrate-binding domain-containing protein n=1 Tax=Holophaga foetida TaxID=35839 RepID=UPI0002474D4C|nr:transporter substrate-binding domain-containing protein [Holophaga foetida]